jgi:NACHT domain
MSEFDFQPYLSAIALHYAQWWRLYTLTDVEGQQQTEQVAPFFDFGLMVQSIASQENDLVGARIPRPVRQDTPEQTEKLEVLAGLRKYASGHVLLVGRPGSGKSTALARLMLEMAGDIGDHDNQGRGMRAPTVPVLVELRSWQTSIVDLIQNSLKQRGLGLENSQIETLLDDGRLLLLIDGVNELPSEAQADIEIFRRNHTKVPMIFTTRDLSLGGDLGIEKKLEMQPLSDKQMKTFVRAYLPEKSEAMLGQLKERLQDFGKTPLLLWMLCEVFDQAPNQQLPNNLAGIFQIFTQMYEDSSVRKHQVAVLKGDVRPLSDRRLWKPALMQLASVMMEGKARVDFRVVIDRSEAEKALQVAFPNESFPVRDILDDLLKFHLLQYRTAEQIEFRHQLIQEYYAAEWLLLRVKHLDDDTLKQDYLNYLKWKEPVALMLGLADEALAVRVVEQAIKVNLKLTSQLVRLAKAAHKSNIVALIESSNLSSSTQYWLFSECELETTITKLFSIALERNSNISQSAALSLVNFPSERLPNEVSEFLIETGQIRIISLSNTNSSSLTLGEINRLRAKREENMTPLEKLFEGHAGSSIADFTVNLWSICSFSSVRLLLSILLDTYGKPYSTKNLRCAAEVMDDLITSRNYSCDEKLLLFLSKCNHQEQSMLAILVRFAELCPSRNIDFLSIVMILSVSIRDDISAVLKEEYASLLEPTSIAFSEQVIETSDLRFIRDVFELVASIQANCKFYNYEIEQQARERRQSTQGSQQQAQDGLARIEDKLDTIDAGVKKMEETPRINISNSQVNAPVGNSGTVTSHVSTPPEVPKGVNWGNWFAFMSLLVAIVAIPVGIFNPEINQQIKQWLNHGTTSTVEQQSKPNK